jgi:hypothetical protein
MRKSAIIFLLTTPFVLKKASHVAYNCRELYKKLEIQIVKHEYVKDCPKWAVIQIWLLDILLAICMKSIVSDSSF